MRGMSVGGSKQKGRAMQRDKDLVRLMQVKGEGRENKKERREQLWEGCERGGRDGGRREEDRGRRIEGKLTKT
eukprot:768047-Hanusia_phi.AAC.2